MKLEDSNWFSKWEDELPSPEELTPLSQSLISPHLANAFDITTTAAGGTATPSPEMGSMAAGAGSGSEEPARTLKRPRLVWTPQLHKRFVDAVAHLGIKNAVPKTIMQMMSVDGLTRENVASHLQKYRLYLKRMQGQNGNSSGGGGGGGVAMDAASERLFASSHVPAHFLSPVRGANEHLVPYVNVSMLPHQQQQQQQMLGMQGQCLRPVGGFGMQNGQIDGCSLPSQGQQAGRIGVGGYSQGMSSVEDLDNVNSNGERKVLTLFPDN